VRRAGEKPALTRFRRYLPAKLDYTKAQNQAGSRIIQSIIRIQDSVLVLNTTLIPFLFLAKDNN